MSSLSLSAVSAPLLAQTNPAPNAKPAAELEEVVVTGIRASLQKSLDIKKNADGVVDAISAEDIGKFPDSNLAAAIQRVPGVSVSRGTSAMGGVPGSTGDATQITVRGFGPSFNETLFDGRKVGTGITPSNGTTGGNRGFDFSSVGADFVGEVDILKTPDAALSSGAIGATINIKYPKPFDHRGAQLVTSGSAKFSPEESKATPNGGILASDTFANDTFGVLAFATYSEHKVRSNHVNIQGWEGTHISPSQLAGAAPGASTDKTITGWFIQDYGIYQEHSDDQRLGGRLAVQWRPSEDVLLTLDDNYSRDRLTQNQYGYSVWFNAGSLTNITQAPDGTLSSFVQPNTPTDFQGQVNGSVIVNNDVGFNVKWNPSAQQEYELDFDTAISKLNPNGELSSIDVDVGYGPSGPNSTCNAPQSQCNATNVGIAGVGNGSLPYPTHLGPNGNSAQFINNGLMGSHVLVMASPRNRDVVNQFRLQGNWSEDNLQLRYGLHYVSDTVHLSEVDDFQNNDWQAFAGYGPASHNTGGAALPQSFFTGSFGTAGFINGFSNNGNLPPGILQFNPLTVLNYLQGLGAGAANKNCCTPPYTGAYQMIPNVGATQVVGEDTFAGFLSASFQAKIAQMPLKISVGVRQEKTDVKSQGVGQLPASLTVQASDHTAFLVGYTPQTIFTKSSSYRYLLPNLDLNLSVTDDLKVRFDASRTLTRPPLAFLAPTLTVAQGQRVGSLVANAFNPNLLPYLSDNLDLGAEWYYARNSYLSAGVFLKEVTNFVVGNTTQQTINGVIDPTTGAPAVFSVTSQINGPSAEVRGIELALQHVFGNTGFGFQLNGTYVNTDKPYNPNDITLSGFAVTGLANSANLVGFYDRNGFQARVAINWRDEYLDHFGQQQNNSAFGQEPTWVNASTQVDFSTSYEFGRNLNVYFEALNLTDETYSTHGRFKEQVLDVIDFGRRFTVGVHWKL